MEEPKIPRNNSKLVRIAQNIALHPESRTIYLTKDTLVPEDILAVRFSKVLDEHGVNYSVVAGYVAILFGRTRRSDDVDFVTRYMNEDDFIELCHKAADAGFKIMQGNIRLDSSVRKVFENYLSQGYGVRFIFDDQILPNIELKIATTGVQNYAINNAYKVIINGEHTTRISPLELQIAYKLYLGSDKDVGDAVFLYTLFKNVLDLEELRQWCNKLSVDCSILEDGE